MGRGQGTDAELPNETRSNGHGHSGFTSSVRVTLKPVDAREGGVVSQPSLDPVDALLARSVGLPAPEVRARLRQAASLTQAEVAEAIGVHRVQVVRWESGQAEPRNPHRRTYGRLLERLAAQYPDALMTTDTKAS
ncbi:helix-turn-helix domain-containing protein [Streptomyces sp. NPDC058394]|uniref:helix-turn-helix domain-containing protein n=1 Tax=Streptomyces sp. NPDC058394 TaxID=3346477 RepID=UPI0036540772